MDNAFLINGCQWIMRIAWLNIIWLILTILSGGFLGFLPASVVISLMIRRYLNGQYKVTLKEILHEYKKIWWRANKITLIFLLPIFSSAWYWHLAVVSDNEIVSILGLALLPICCLTFSLWFCCAIQISQYQTDSIRQDLDNGLGLLIKGYKWVIGAMFLIIIMLGLSSILPLVGVFYCIAPSFVMVIFWQQSTMDISESNINLV